MRPPARHILDARTSAGRSARSVAAPSRGASCAAGAASRTRYSFNAAVTRVSRRRRGVVDDQLCRRRRLAIGDEQSAARSVRDARRVPVGDASHPPMAGARCAARRPRRHETPVRRVAVPPRDELHVHASAASVSRCRLLRASSCSSACDSNWFVAMSCRRPRAHRRRPCPGWRSSRDTRAAVQHVALQRLDSLLELAVVAAHQRRPGGRPSGDRVGDLDRRVWRSNARRALQPTAAAGALGAAQRERRRQIARPRSRRRCSGRDPRAPVRPTASVVAVRAMAAMR